MIKKRGSFEIAGFIILCVLFNVGGKFLAGAWQLPIWMDSFGTALSAYVAGPFVGAMVGLASNVVYGVWDRVSFFYAPISMVIGILIGIFSKKKVTDSLLGILNVSALLTIAALVLSVPINYYFQDGKTGNIWGDAVNTYFSMHGFKPFACIILAEFYIDFLDKLLLMLALFACVLIRRKLIAKHKEKQLLIKKMKMLMSIALILSLLGTLFTPGTVYAKEEEEKTDYNTFVQTVYDRENGLTCGEANCTAVTNDGILWVGTYSGLYRYSGTKFSLISDFDSIKNVNGLYVDAEGRLWVGTNDNGISLVINDEVANVLEEEGGLPSNSVRSITEDGIGNYYAGTSDALARIGISNGLRVKEVYEEIQYAKSISSNMKGIVAAVTSRGKLFLLQDGKIISENTYEKENEIYNSCAFLSDGSLVVGTSESKVIRYVLSEDDEPKLIKESEKITDGISNLQCFYEADNGDIFISADNGAGVVYHDGTYQRLKVGDFSSSIDNVKMDYQGNIWFSSSRLGLLKLSKSAFSEIYQAYGMSERVVNTEVVWNGLMYLGTDTGLDCIRLDKTEQLENDLTKQLEGIRIRCLIVDSKNQLWIATGGDGIYCVAQNGKMDHFTEATDNLPGNKYRNVLELSDGSVFVGGDSGIVCFKDNKVFDVLRKDDGITNEKILSLMEAPDKRVYVGTDGGGIIIIRDQKVERVITKHDGLTSGVILRTVMDEKNEGMFIVASNGILYMNKQGIIQPIKNFPYYNNYDILNYNGRTYVLGGAGVFSIESESFIQDNNLSYVLYDTKTGMRYSITSNAWNYMDESGTLYIGSDTGCCIVNLNELDNMKQSYRILLNQVLVDDVKLHLNNETHVNLKRDVSSITFYPEVINYSVNDPYVSYYLEGYEKEETVVIQSELGPVEYDNLPVGEYSFHLAVLNGSGTEKIEEVICEVSKEKELYDNWWFLLYLVAIFAIAVAWLTWFITSIIMQRKIAFQKKELELERNKVKMGNETILAIARTVDAKDENTANHSIRVSDYSIMIARECGFSDEEIENLSKMALLHDIGKIKIPDAILNKPDKLTDEEYAIMKQHTVYGGEILKGFTLIDHVADGALYHHERWDGRGYPFGLKGEEIPLCARIIAISDSFDAMTAKRVYRDRMDFTYVLGQLKGGRGTQFDPNLLDIFLGLIENNRINIEALYSDTEDEEIQKSISQTSVLKAIHTEVMKKEETE